MQRPKCKDLTSKLVNNDSVRPEDEATVQWPDGHCWTVPGVLRRDIEDTEQSKHQPITKDSKDITKPKQDSKQSKQEILWECTSPAVGGLVNLKPVKTRGTIVIWHHANGGQMQVCQMVVRGLSDEDQVSTWVCKIRENP